MKEVKMKKGLLVLLYSMAFLLLREWLLPVIELTETNYMTLFLLFIVFAFFLSVIDAKWWLAVPLKVLYISWATLSIYRGERLGTLESLINITNNLRANLPILLAGDWQDITNPLRTVLFFVLLWMLTYLVRYWIEVRKSIFMLFVFTVIFIAIIDTFSSYTASDSIFRVMVVGLLALGLLTILKMAARHQIHLSSRMLVTMVVPLVMIIVVSTVFAVILPKADPIWADPVPYFKTVTGNNGEGEGKGDGVGAIAESGYSPDDSRLGGPLLIDDSLVFEASVDKKQYWKIETKNTYTSKGWEQSYSDEEVVVYTPGVEMMESSNENMEEPKEKKRAELTMVEKFPFLIYPYGLTTVFTEEDVEILNKAQSGEYRTEVRNKEFLDDYELEYKEQTYSLKTLRETKMESLSSLEGFEPYLQLPETLPDRVGELAASITASHESVYDKAKGIERYFGRNGFVYDLEDVGIPEEEEDYVDQFLFDTKRGYCDNYSSSMVVMLRTLGIPARWAKGFAPGEIVRNENDKRVYEVTNKEAHSWVEAYMPGIGWMPFEPTIGFNGLTDIDYDIELAMDDPEIPEMPEEKREKFERDTLKTVEETKRSFSLGEVFGKGTALVKARIAWILLAVIALVCITWFMFARRRKWLPKLLVRMQSTDNGGWTVFSKQYNSLLKQLEQYGMQRDKGETLFMYAVKVDYRFGGNRMRELTNAYEKGIYGEDREDQDWQRLQEVWEYLIIRTSD